jgi:small conductance mechanosensitive channel
VSPAERRLAFAAESDLSALDVRMELNRVLAASAHILLAESRSSLFGAVTPTPTPSGSSSAGVGPTPTPTPTDVLPDVSLEGVRNALFDSCGDPPGLLCRTVYDLTKNDYLASSADVLLGTPLRILLILMIAFFVRTMVHRFIGRSTAKLAAGTSGRLFRGRANGIFGASALMIERRRQRAETVGSLLRSLTSIVVFGLAFITILGEIGINLAPIVASAGIFGIAIGFGAQNLVRDFLSGLFMLLEDQYGVGDVIDAGEASGAVEAVTLRITRLRDVEGTVWYVRNGEILRIGNRSQGWARAVLDIPLNYDIDVSEAKEILKTTADGMWRDEKWTPLILDEPEVWGVETMTDSGYSVRLVIKTQPLKQWEVSRELRERVRAKLAERGIQLGSMQRSEITVRDEDDEDGVEFPPRQRREEAEGENEGDGSAGWSVGE